MSLEHIEVGSFAPNSPHTETAETLRVVSWNINRGGCMDLILSFLIGMDADIILLQECDSNVLRSGLRNVAREIAQELRMNYIFGVEFVELSQGNGKQPAHHGQATLCRMQLSNPRILRFESQSNFWAPRWFLPRLHPLQRRLGGRMALVSEIIVNQATLALYNLHLESRSSDELRCRQIKEILDDADRYGPEVPVILGGDFNFDINTAPPRAAVASSEFRNPFATHKLPTVRMQRRLSGRSIAIDWIIIRGQVTAESPHVHTSALGSDHCPLSLTLRLM